MKVYQIDADINNMRCLAPETYDFDLMDKLFLGKSIKDIFDPKKERYYMQELKTKYMDFYHSSAHLTLAKKAHESLGACLEMYGEIYPIKITNAPKSDDIAYFFNMLTIINPYDVKKTEWSVDYKGKKDRPIKPIFQKKKITEAFFIIPYGHKDFGYCPELFCTDGLLPPEEEFYHIYQNSGLKGLRFKEIELT